MAGPSTTADVRLMCTTLLAVCQELSRCPSASFNLAGYACDILVKRPLHNL